MLLSVDKSGKKTGILKLCDALRSKDMKGFFIGIPSGSCIHKRMITEYGCDVGHSFFVSPV